MANSSSPPARLPRSRGAASSTSVWSFADGGDGNSHFGKMPPAVVENLLWFYTKPGDIMVDPPWMMEKIEPTAPAMAPAAIMAEPTACKRHLGPGRIRVSGEAEAASRAKPG